jgi:acetyl esterase/lipase
MKSKMLASAILLSISLASTVHAADGPNVLDVWPGTPPGETGTVAEEKADRKGDGPITGITNVTKPTLAVYRPEKEKNTGAAIVVCPGGGYNMLAWDHEGEQVARWLNSIGVTAAVLKYRVPRRPGSPKDQPPVQALMDAQRSLSLVRENSEKWGVDPKRIGILGFSAGGHLGAWASTNFDKRAYDAIDAADKASCRPDFAVLIYPGGVLKRGSDELAPEIRVAADTPPTFLAHAGDDPVNAENSVRYYLALKKAKVPAELHIFGTGGHGFGMRPGEKAYAAWPKRCEEWMRDQKILTAASGH